MRNRSTSTDLASRRAPNNGRSGALAARRSFDATFSILSVIMFPDWCTGFAEMHLATAPGRLWHCRNVARNGGYDFNETERATVVAEVRGKAGDKLILPIPYTELIAVAQR